MSLNATAVRIKVTLKDVKPEVMRRLFVSVTLRLDRLHLTLQEAFGWTNSHLFEFHAGEERWGAPIPTLILTPSPSMPARRGSAISFTNPAPRRSTISTTSASWDHVIKLEKWFDNTTIEGLLLLLQAAGRCPPEDSAVRRAMPNTSTPSATLP